MARLIIRADGSVGAELEDQDALTTPHWAQIDSFNPSLAKPIQVTRTWQGRSLQTRCFVTQAIKDAFQAGDLAVGDFVLVLFVDGDRDLPLAVSKILKTW